VPAPCCLCRTGCTPGGTPPARRPAGRAVLVVAPRAMPWPVFASDGFRPPAGPRRTEAACSVYFAGSCISYVRCLAACGITGAALSALNPAASLRRCRLGGLSVRAAYSHGARRPTALCCARAGADRMCNSPGVPYRSNPLQSNNRSRACCLCGPCAGDRSMAPNTQLCPLACPARPWEDANNPTWPPPHPTATPCTSAARRRSPCCRSETRIGNRPVRARLGPSLEPSWAFPHGLPPCYAKRGSAPPRSVPSAARAGLLPWVGSDGGRPGDVGVEITGGPWGDDGAWGGAHGRQRGRTR